MKNCLILQFQVHKPKIKLIIIEIFINNRKIYYNKAILKTYIYITVINNRKCTTKLRNQLNKEILVSTETIYSSYVMKVQTYSI